MKSNPRRAKKRTKPAPSLRVRWKKSSALSGVQGDELRRHFKLETLASAVERLLHENDRFIVPSIQAALGPAPVVSLDFQETLSHCFAPHPDYKPESLIRLRKFARANRFEVFAQPGPPFLRAAALKDGSGEASDHEALAQRFAEQGVVAVDLTTADPFEASG